jgi:ABC-type nitrate/sulfonate/bicarbonate transport system substrate-binding protein
LQEALVAGKVDTGIMPFTYAWNAVARGNNLKIASFFERETDGIVAGSSIQDITELETKKVGMLKASTLEILFEDATHSRGIQCSKVYFRSPNEMVSALQAGQIDAMVGYVPLIQKMSDKYKVIHWFSSDYSAHPCCDIVLNQDQMSKGKQALHDKLLADLKLVIEEVAIPSESVVSFAMKQYGLNRDQVFDSLKHTVFRMGLDDAGKAFERKMTDISVGLGYQPNQILDSDIYLER